MSKQNHQAISRRKVTKRFLQGFLALGLTNQVRFVHAKALKLDDQTLNHGTMTGHCLQPREKLELGLALLKTPSTLKDMHIPTNISLTKNWQDEIQQDYQNLNLVFINGWTLSKTEAQLYTAAARSSA